MLADFELVLHRPLETAPLIVMWDLPRFPVDEKAVYQALSRDTEGVLGSAR